MASSEPSFKRRRANPLLRTMLKVPSLIYRGPLADLMRSRCVLLLTTRGRKSGRPRTGAVSFMPVDDHFVVFSGWGVGSNWFRNIRANPRRRAPRAVPSFRVFCRPAGGGGGGGGVIRPSRLPPATPKEEKKKKE